MSATVTQTHGPVVRRGRARLLAIVVLGIAIELLGLGVLFMGWNLPAFSPMIVGDEILGFFLMLVGFVILGVVTGLFKGSPYRFFSWSDLRGLLPMERRRREEEKRKRKPSD